MLDPIEYNSYVTVVHDMVFVISNGSVVDKVGNCGCISVCKGTFDFVRNVVAARKDELDTLMTPDENGNVPYWEFAHHERIAAELHAKNACCMSFRDVSNALAACGY